MREVYLDNSATTCVSEAAAKKCLEAMTLNYGNPSSLHTKGVEAEEYIRTAAALISSSIGASSDEIYFTSGGTESNNLAVFGAAQARKRLGNRIVTTAIEHHSVLESAQELEKQGFEVVYLKPDRYGHISEEAVSDAVDEKTVLVSMMLVNNEVGSIMPVSAAAKAIKQKKAPALLHCDAVQAFGKMPVKVSALGCDLLSITAHKIHGPKGVGALYKRKNVHIVPCHFGGEQQKKIRPGTEPVPLIAAFGEAVRELDIACQYDKVKTLRDRLADLVGQIDGITVNSPEDALPYIFNLSTNLVRSEIMLHYLASRGIFCSSGSACAKGEPSHVLSSMGVSRKSADTALRISFSKLNSLEDVDEFAAALREGLAKLKH